MRHMTPVERRAFLLRIRAMRIGGRRIGADRGEGFGRRKAVPGELLVRARATRVIAQTGIAD